MTWIEKISSFCQEYNIPIEYLAETLNDPKVIPMIRGKAFEFSVMLSLHEILAGTDFEVSKLSLNPQLTIHDQDLTLTHKPSNLQISLECKLAAKGQYSHLETGDTQIRIKCMRSRTLGLEMVKRQAPLWGVPENSLLVHNDQYLPRDFDLVVTSIGNAFYETNRQTGVFEWAPSDVALSFLGQLAAGSTPNLKDFAFQQIYLARSKHLSIHPQNQVSCTRKECPSPDDCGFIPNYPVIHFPKDSRQPAWPWSPLADSLPILEAILAEKLAGE
jgi:hypothetical protein